MAGRKYNREKKVRNARFRVMCDLLYNRSYERPQANVVVSTPTKLAHSNSLKAHILADCLDWLNENGYIKNLEWGYGHVQLEIITKHLQVKTGSTDSASPSPCAVGGGTENIIASLSSVRHFRKLNVDGTYSELTEEEYKKLTEGEEPCQEIQPEVTISQDKSEKPSKTSTSQPRLKLRLKPRSTTE